MTGNGSTAVRWEDPRGRRQRWAVGFAAGRLSPEPIGALSPRSYEAVLTALEAERKARAFDAAVLERFPGAMPFRMIAEAATRHVEALAGLLRRRGLSVPSDRHLGGAAARRAVPATVTCACRIAVAAEAETVELYEDELLARVAGLADVERMFRRLAEASRERHMPAFRHWVDHHPHGGRA